MTDHMRLWYRPSADGWIDVSMDRYAELLLFVPLSDSRRWQQRQGSLSRVCCRGSVWIFWSDWRNCMWVYGITLLNSQKQWRNNQQGRLDDHRGGRLGERRRSREL